MTLRESQHPGERDKSCQLNCPSPALGSLGHTKGLWSLLATPASATRCPHSAPALECSRVASISGV